MPSSEPRSTFHLSPFAFPVETDMRFLMLLIAAAGTAFGLANYAVYVVLQLLLIADDTAKLISICGAFVIVLLLFGLAHHRAKHAAHALVAHEQWAAFPPLGGTALEQASLRRMSTHVEQLLKSLPDVAMQRLHFYWNDCSADREASAGVAFGYRGTHYLCLNEGLHADFLAAPHTKRFHSVLLHELGHIANRDVSRTTFSIQLGYTFTQFALVLATITIGFLIFNISRRFMSGTSDQTALTVLGIIIQTALGAALVIALIEIIRASVLRVREYYADARASQWLGSAAALIDIFARQSASFSERPARASAAAPSIVPQRVLQSQPSFRRYLRDYLAPLHPSHKRRIDALTSPSLLFEVDLSTAFISSLLIGLALSANSLVFNLPLQLGSFATNWLAEHMTEQMGRTAWYAIYALALLITALGYIGFVVLFILFCLVPLIGTIGVMVQRAAFVDHTGQRQGTLLPLRRLVLLALLMGSGVMLGGTLTPVSGVLSIQHRDWIFVPAFVSMWSIVMFIWLLPLRWLAGRAYHSHVGPKPPTLRRRCVAVLAALAVTPMLLFSMFGQGAVITADLNDTSAGLLPSLFNGWLLSLPLSLITWGIGALLMRLAGWFDPARCPGCGKPTSHTTAITLHCTHCGHALKSWAVTPAAVSVPALPPFVPLVSDETPPLLS